MNHHCECPHCGANLRGPTIPEESREKYYGYAPGDPCRYGCGEEPHFSRLIGIYDTELDRTVKWSCPDCRKVWDR